MKAVSILDSVLQEEYDRSIRMKQAMEKERDALPKGYISEKMISGKKYYYLQNRQQAKIVSKYINLDDVESIKEKISRRKQLENSIKELNDNIEKIRKVTS